MAILKGQNFRVLTYDSTASKFKCVGMATNCTVTLNGNTEDASTKDDVGMSAKPTVVSKSWQVQVDSLNVADAGAMLTAIKSLTPFTLLWDEVSTTDNQTPEEAALSRTGTAYLSDITFNFNSLPHSNTFFAMLRIVLFVFEKQTAHRSQHGKARHSEQPG